MQDFERLIVVDEDDPIKHLILDHIDLLKQMFDVTETASGLIIIEDKNENSDDGLSGPYL